jgi:hypothetical protein
MKDARVIGRHKRDCWYRGDNTDPRGWYLNTYNGVYHDSVRGHRVVYLDCNCPKCPAKLRVRVDRLEDYAVGLLELGA